MMDRALKESLDAASTQDADSVNEQRMLEMALKASLATSKNTKVHDNATVVFVATRCVEGKGQKGI